MSSRVSIATPTFPTSPADKGIVAIETHLSRQVEGHRKPGLAGFEQATKASVGVLGAAETGVLAHRPGPAPIHRGMGPAGERILPGLADSLRIGRGVVDGLDFDAAGSAHVIPAVRG